MSMTVAALFTLSTLITTLTMAQDPVVHSDGSVTVRVVLDASEDEVRQQLDTAAEASALHSDTKLIGREAMGRCEKLTYQTRGMVSPFSYVAMRCPTDNGWKQTLLSSEDFKANEAEWELTEVEGGTELRYRVQVKLDMPIGQSLVNSQIAQSMKQALARLESKLGR